MMMMMKEDETWGCVCLHVCKLDLVNILNFNYSYFLGLLFDCASLVRWLLGNYRINDDDACASYLIMVSNARDTGAA